MKSENMFKKLQNPAILAVSQLNISRETKAFVMAADSVCQTFSQGCAQLSNTYVSLSET